MNVKVAVVSDSLQPHGLYSSWHSPGQNTGVGSLSLFQGIFPAQGSNPGLPHCSRTLYQLSHKGSPRILEWVAYPFSSRSSQPRNRTRVSCIAGGFFTNWAEGSLKESNQVTTELTHHALILHIIGREGPELGSCRVHSRLPWVQPIKENELQKSSRTQGPHTYKCFPLRLCREHTGLGVWRLGLKARLNHL